ncbi:MAG: transporter substrate-binding domain-containing protein [Chlamydiota bacterium]
MKILRLLRPSPAACSMILAAAFLAGPLRLHAELAFVEKKPLHVVTRTFEPFVIREGGQYKGFAIDLWDKLAKEIGRTYTLEDAGTITALLDKVWRKQADAGIGGIGISADREQLMDFSHPFFRAGLQVMVLRRSSSPIECFFPTFFEVVRSQRNSFLLIIGVLVAFMLLSAHIVWLCERRRNPEFPPGYLRGIWDSLWWSAQTATTVGYGDKAPRGVPGRLFGMIWMVGGCLIFTYLTASVTTHLTLRELRGAITGPSDLPGKRVATVKGSTASDYLVAALIPAAGFDTIAEACRALQIGQADAVVYDSPVLMYLAARSANHELKVVGPVFRVENYGIALPTASPLREEINRAILKFDADGTYRELHAKWFGPGMEQ